MTTALTESKQTASERAEWLDGPALVEWMRKHGLENVKAFGGTVATRITRWQRGSRANVYMVDPLLVKLHLHLTDIPEDIWIDAPRTGQKIDHATVSEILARLDAGASIRSLAREFRVAPSTVRFHRDRSEMAKGPRVCGGLSS